MEEEYLYAVAHQSELNETISLKKYLCFKFESIISSCEIYSVDSSEEKIKIFFAW